MKKSVGEGSSSDRNDSVSASEKKTLRRLERMRRKVLFIRFISVSIISLVSLAYIGVCFYVIWQEGPTTREIRLIMVCCGAVFMMAVLLLGLLTRSVLHSYAAKYKETLVRGVLSEVFPDGCDYRPDSGFTHEYVKKLPLFKNTNGFDSEDYIASEYDGVKFKQADVTVLQIMGRNSTRYFEGRLFEFETGVNPGCRIQVYSRDFPTCDDPPEKLGLVSVPLPEGFGDRFIELSDNPELAATLMSNDALDRLDSIAGRFDGVNLYISGDRLYIAARSDGGSAFEPTVKQKLNLDYEKNRIREELGVIEGLIEAFKPGFPEDTAEREYSRSGDGDYPEMERPKREPIR